MDPPGWTQEMTRKLRKLRDMTWSYTWIHRQNSIFLNDIYEWVSILSFSLNFFNGIILMFPTNIVYVRIFNVILAFSSGIIGFYIKQKKFPETAERHKIASSKFSGIHNNITRQLSLNIANREGGAAYHRWITTQYDSLRSTAPDIDPPIIDEYKHKFAHKRKFNPIEAAEYDKGSSNWTSSEESSDVFSVLTHSVDNEESISGSESSKDEVESMISEDGGGKQMVIVNTIKPKRKKHIDYEKERFNNNRLEFTSGINSMSMSTKCLIPEFQLDEPRISVRRSSKDIFPSGRRSSKDIFPSGRRSSKDISASGRRGSRV